MKRSVGPFSLTAGNQPLARECWLFPALGQEILTHLLLRTQRWTPSIPVAFTALPRSFGPAIYDIYLMPWHMASVLCAHLFSSNSLAVDPAHFHSHSLAWPTGGHTSTVCCVRRLQSEVHIQMCWCHQHHEIEQELHKKLHYLFFHVVRYI